MVVNQKNNSSGYLKWLTAAVGSIDTLTCSLSDAYLSDAYNGMYGDVRGRKTRVGRKLLRFPPTRLLIIVSYYFYQSNSTVSPFNKVCKSAVVVYV